MKKRILSVLLSAAFIAGICLTPLTVSATSADGGYSQEYTNSSEADSTDTASNAGAPAGASASDDSQQIPDASQTPDTTQASDTAPAVNSGSNTGDNNAIPADSTDATDAVQSDASGSYTVSPSSASDIPLDIPMLSIDTLPDENTLFAMYVDEQFGVDYFQDTAQSAAETTTSDPDALQSVPTYNSLYAYYYLSDVEKVFYDAALSLIRDIAEGRASNTQVYYTDEELDFGGLSTIYVDDLYDYTLVNGSWNPTVNSQKLDEAVSTLQNRFAIDQRKVINALSSDYPEYLYWFGRSFQIGLRSYGYQNDVESDLTISGSTATGPGSVYASFTIYLTTSSSYAKFTDSTHYSLNTVDTAKTSATSTAVANANSIITSYNNLADYEKLLAYKNYICSNVTYNQAAANSSLQNMGSNPWELIYVFDNDPSTNVVCEGYSKAFQYLCDRSSFTNSVEAICVTGGMDGGAHMWNIVKINGINYLADITNCDTEYITNGHEGLFMKGYTRGSLTDGYIVHRPDISLSGTSYIPGSDIEYDYDSDILTLYADHPDRLTLSSTDFEPVTYSAGATTTIYPEMTYGQTDARSMLASINSFRTGSNAWYWNSDNSTKTWQNNLSALTYDYGLEQNAMQRAAEIAVIFDHTRPNGQSCWTVYTNGNGYKAENIAAGYSSVSGTFNQWLEESEDYSGQGHRRNMLNPNVKYVGIGHVYYNGYHYWVQEFNSVPTSLTATTANDTLTSTTVQVLESNITNTSVSWAENSATRNMSAGQSYNVASPVANYTVTGHWPSNTVSAPVSSSSYTIISNNPAIASVTGNTVTAQSAGTTNVLCQMGQTVVGTSTLTVAGASGNIPVKEIWIYGNQIGSTSLEIPVGTSYPLMFEIWPQDATNKKVTVTSSNPNIVAVLSQNGTTATIFGGSIGTAVITATAQDGSGVTESIPVTIVPVFQVTTPPTDVTAGVGETFTFSIEASGQGLSYQWYYRDSANSNWTTWPNGTTASISGTMTAAMNGRQFYCAITGPQGQIMYESTPVTLSLGQSSNILVTNVAFNVNNNIANTASINIYQGDTYQPTVVVEPSNATNKTLTWSSSNTGVATVNTNGTITGIAPGTATITATSTDGSRKSATITVTVCAPLAITQQPTDVTAKAGDRFTFSVAATGTGLTYQWQ